MPICIGPAAPNAFDPLRTPGSVVRPSSLSTLPIPASTTQGTLYRAPIDLNRARKFAGIELLAAVLTCGCDVVVGPDEQVLPVEYNRPPPANSSIGATSAPTISSVSRPASPNKAGLTIPTGGLVTRSRPRPTGRTAPAT